MGRPVDAAAAAVHDLLIQLVGKLDAGTKETPGRVARAMRELTAGYGVEPAELLARTFDAECDEMVVLRAIPFQSMCEHHLLPFVGTADVAYLPTGGKVVGLSKLARLVDAYALRLQLQERLTSQVTDAIREHLSPDAACVVRAKHYCMGHRGVRKPGAEMVTSSLLGRFRSEPALRAEFMNLIS